MKIKNTSKSNPLENLMVSMENGGIERQEKQGQSQLVNSQLLPIEFIGEKSILEKRGVVFGEPLKDDSLFCECTLPEGWSKKGSNHDMWSDLIDENGNVVANIFYKAAFYDRRATLHILKQED